MGENATEITKISDVCDIIEDDKSNVENIKCLLHMRASYNSCVFYGNNNFTPGSINTLLEFCLGMKIR